MTRTVLVTGATGLLGRQVLTAFDRDGWNVVGTGLTRADPELGIVQLDLPDKDQIERVLDKVKPKVIVHCAAIRAPDSCSSNPDLARAVNADAPAHLARLAYARGIFLLYISTDYVFSGQPGEAPYPPNAKPDPPNLYGQTKLEGEQAVLEATATPDEGGEYPRTKAAIYGLVLRVPILYGSAPQGDPSESAVNVLVGQVWKAQEVQEGQEKIKMDNYAQRYPTNTQDVARVIRELAKVYLDHNAEVEADGEGKRELPLILHFSSEQKYTKWEMCQVIADILGLPLERGMEPYRPSGEEVGQQGGVKRPYDCHLDTKELRELDIDDSNSDFTNWWYVASLAIAYLYIWQ